MKKNIHPIVLFGLLMLGEVSCQSDHPQVFKQLASGKTGIHFNNKIEENEQYNVVDFANIYTGAGVAAGDVNNDGLTDLYFSGNMVSGRLYLNKGDLAFEDITESSGIENVRWGTGVTMVDINQDGWLDIYVCVSGIGPLPERANLLYINNGTNADGIPTFTESAADYGIADTRQAMHAAFFDYDKDDDLDLFLILNTVDYTSRVNQVRPKQVNGEASSTDVLYRNDALPPLSPPGGGQRGGRRRFTDVSREAGILIEGYSLGLGISDINGDNWPDIYISNDFLTNDVLYVNNKDGTFADQASEYLKHTSFAGMGNDVADFNNDGLVDIMVLDMRPEDNKRQKLTLSSASYDHFQLALDKGYDPQYGRNTLQLNRGNGVFSEIGFLSGVSSTDWSWAPLFADYDNDGDKDLFVTNGFLRDLGNLDYITYQNIYNIPIGTDAAKKVEKLEAIKSLEDIEYRDYVYENNSDLTFTNRSYEWGIRNPGYSNGAAYVDLDNDGDLELVVNNINDEAHIYENRVTQLLHRHYIKIKLNGTDANRDGIGAKIWVKYNGKMQFYEHFPFRGYESTVDPLAHFGLDTADTVDTLEVVWPDGKYQQITDVAANQVVDLHYQDAETLPEKQNEEKPQTLFREVSDKYSINYQHQENQHVDFKIQPLLPHMHSRNGPGIAVGDVNRDGLADFFIGGAAGYPGQFSLQQPDGSFESERFIQDSLSEDMGVLLFDADNDGDLDLYVVSGGSSYPKNSPKYQDRLYLNDGMGKFTKTTHVLPEIKASGSSVTAADYDQDGDLDLFVGGRIVPGEYPLSAKSYLLRNDTPPPRGGRSVTFTDVTQEVAPGLSNAGLVTAALWTDYDNDGWVDLLVAGEFMSLQFYHNVQGQLINVTDNTGLQHTGGWWNSLSAGDFDKDGDTDYLAGNLGLNSRFRASPEEPLCVYARDYDKNGSIDPVMCYYIQGENYIAHPRNKMIAQINAMRARFRTYTEYAEATFEESFLPEELSSAYVVRSDRFESSYVENLGGGKFRMKALPITAQLAPVFGMLTGDFDEDGNLDVLLAGNSYATEVETGRYDAHVGLYLQGDGKGNFTPIDSKKSGFWAGGDAKGMAGIVLADGNRLVLIANNKEQLQAYAIGEKGAVYQANPEDAYALITMENGATYKHEFYYGSTYLSHSSRTIRITPDMKKIVIFDVYGERLEKPLVENL